MIARFGFRWILPCVMVALALCLLGVSIATEPNPWPTAHLTKPTDSGETVTFSPTPYPPTSTTFKIATILNFPAMFAGAIAAAFVPHIGQTMDIAICTIFAFPLWYRIGRWIDRQRAPAGPPPLGPVRDTLRDFGRIIAGFLLPGCLYELGRTWRYEAIEFKYPLLGFVLWCACYLALSFWGGRREKRRAV